MEVKIGKINISVTSNGTPKAVIWTEGSDYESSTDTIEILGDEVIYLATRKIGETVEVVTKGRWKNIVIPKEYQEALTKPAYDRIKLLFSRGIKGIDTALNGTRPSIDIDVAKTMLVDDLDIFLKMQDVTLKTIQECNTKYAKDIALNLNKPLNEQTVNSYAELSKLTQMCINNIQRDYRIQNNYEEIVTEENDTKKVKKKNKE